MIFPEMTHYMGANVEGSAIGARMEEFAAAGIKFLQLGPKDLQKMKGSTNDFTTAEQTKLAGIEEEANKTVVDATLDDSSTNPVQNKVIKSALDGKQASLTTAQLAAANSGITADIVAADTAALTELVDSGAKNLLQHTTTTQTLNGVAFTVNTDGTIIANGTASSSAIVRLNYFSNLSIPDGNYVLSGCPSGGSANSYRLDITRSPGSSINDIGNGVAFEVGGSYTPNEIRLVILSGTVCDNLTFKPMICSKAEWDISQAYQPYVPSNKELAESKITSDIPVVDGSILDYADSIAVGHYQVARQGSASGTGKPITGRRYIYNIYTYSAATATIVAYEGEVSPVMYINLKISGVWQGWFKFV